MNNKSIQILRTNLDNTHNRVKDEVLLDGQPFYNKTLNKIYIGDGSTKISRLKYVGQEFEDSFPLTTGDQPFSVVQRRIKSDNSTITTTKAYQRGSAAFGGGTVAGDSSGAVTAYSFAFAANENNEAIARSSAAFGRYNKTYNPGEFVCGNYAEGEEIDKETGKTIITRNAATVFLVGGGTTSTKRHNAFEVRTEHKGAADISRAFIGGKQVATEEYVSNKAVKKMGNSYVVYTNGGKDENGNVIGEVIPYRFNEESIEQAEFPLMFQPMVNGRLYTRKPDKDLHAANKGYVDAADGALSTRINDEQVTRETADNNLGTRITNETKLTSEAATSDTVKFKIGKQDYEKTINNVANAKNVSEDIANMSIATIFAREPGGGPFIPVVLQSLQVVFSASSNTSDKLPLLLGDNSVIGANSRVYHGGSRLAYQIDSETLSVSNIKATNKIEAKEFNATSDKRLKENIQPFEYKKSILNLPIYTFNFKSDVDKITHIGCLAQDLQEICPEIVHENENGYLSIEETKLVYLLLEEVKGLKAEIDKLRRV